MKFFFTILLFLIIIKPYIVAQEIGHATNTDNKLTIYKNSIESSLYNTFGYNCIVVKANHWGIGFGLHGGLGLRYNILKTEYLPKPSGYGNDPKEELFRFSEILKVNSFFHLRYFKTNYIETGIFGSLVLIPNPGLSYTNSLSMGIETAIFYGWKKFKFGSRVQIGIVYYRPKSQIPHNIFNISLEPIVFKYHWERKK